MATSRRQSLREGVLLLLLAAVPALLTGWLHPKRPVWSGSRPSVEQVDLGDVSRWTTPVLWVDARASDDFNQRHIPGAVLLNENAWESLLPAFLDAWRPEARVIVYCNTQECDASQSVAARLKRELNLTEIYVLKGGWSAWLQTHH